MVNDSIVDRVLNRHIRVSSDNDPMLPKRFKDRYHWTCLENLKVSLKILERIMAQRMLTDHFELRYDRQLAVIIPFRNRHDHLKSLVPILKRKLRSKGIEHEIFVIDEVDCKPFNTAKLINAGVKLAGDAFDYFCPHDVDMVPMDCTYGFPSAPFRILSHVLSNGETRKLSGVFFSGAISVSIGHFITVNGFSNNLLHKLQMRRQLRLHMLG